jgi:RNA polymerase sigma-B factor
MLVDRTNISTTTSPPRSIDRPVRPADTAEDAADVSPLVLEHLWLADSMARRFRGRGEDDDDLQQVARCALLEAARRYDPAQGPFAPFAAPTISGVLKRHFRDHGWVVRPPRQTQQLALRITQQWSEVAQERGGLPTDAELADSLDESVATIREARCASQGYRTVPIDGLTSMAVSAAGDDPGYEQCEARVLVRETWELLSAEEQDLLWMRFWEQRSQSDIATRIGTSQMQVSRLLARILARLRKELRAPEESAA